MAYSYESHVPSRAEMAVGMIADAIRRRRDRREFAKFVQRNPAEAERVARDLNLDTATLMKIAGHSSGPPILLGRRLQILGIDPEELRRREPATKQDLERCCTLCGSKARCSRDLATKPKSDSWKDYCPNEPTLTALAPSAAAH